ncbi:hypothetical protein [Actinoallomurus sp. NPDC050550]|uniref:hypothetical protein n=1 Tax=Actinoallomurus sp. NPDC050550 TaxID=3154937 RepID=UPI0033D345F6
MPHLHRGIALFILGSLLGGCAISAASLLAAGAVQGTGAALGAPSGLALIATNFPQRAASGTVR